LKVGGLQAHRTKLPAGISKYQIPVLTMADRAGARRADVLPDHSAPPLMAVLARHLRTDAVLCSDRDPAYDFFARQNGVPHHRIDTKKGPFVIDRAFHIQTINNLHDRFERFMEAFCASASQSDGGHGTSSAQPPTNLPAARPRSSCHRPHKKAENQTKKRKDTLFGSRKPDRKLSQPLTVSV
jgi:hypothetical protein